MRLKEYAMLITSLLGTLTIGGLAINAWTDYGWVTKRAYLADDAAYVRRVEFDTHVAAQQAVNGEVQQKQNEILAYVKVVPNLEALLRNRCMGGVVPQQLIDDLKREYRELTGERYQEPACDRLLALVQPR